MNPSLSSVAFQFALAIAYYAAIVVIVRMAGKRLAGQVTSFDLIVLIGLAVVLQELTLEDGKVNAIVFILTVLLVHRTVAHVETRSPRLRTLLRGKPRTLIVNGKVLPEALEAEGISEEDLSAGLRKLGFASRHNIRLAVLEETGHISAIASDEDKPG